ncbi:MAG: ISLre2 family transposase, partial [Candidatus Atribacteria bacterium]|nr:ISLre2 family transposase [Candidatus Atribacteria bacterium]
YLHLLDEQAGFKKRRRIDPLLEALIVEKAIDCSYQKAGREILPKHPEGAVSPEVVKRLVHNLKKEEAGEEGLLDKGKEPIRKKCCQYLFIEADEDHVPWQRKREKNINQIGERKKRKKKRLLAKLVYVHEGKETLNSGRVQLKNPHYFAGLYEDTEDLFYEVLDYLEEHYDLDKVNCIFLGGDGASWIKKGLEILPKSLFVLDRFHLVKRLQGALHHNAFLEKKLWKALKEDSWEKVQAILLNALSDNRDVQERKRLEDLLIYLKNNWEGILNSKRYKELELAVSAEGHVSHVLSARLSHRPMGWGKKGADHMSYLRALKFNRCSVRNFYLRTHQQELPAFTLSLESIQKEKEKGKKGIQEVYDNIPVMKGPVDTLRLTIKALTQEMSWVPVI